MLDVLNTAHSLIDLRSPPDNLLEALGGNWAGLPLLQAEDRYENDQGRMWGKLAGMKTIFDETGEKLTHASMVR